MVTPCLFTGDLEQRLIWIWLSPLKSQEQFDALLGMLRSADFEPTLCSPNNPLLVVVDRKEGIEFELWTKPDGIVFDEETIKRRRKAHLGEGIMRMDCFS